MMESIIENNNANIEFIINNELNRLKEEEKTLKDALFLKTRKYIFNNVASTNLKNTVEIINHNKIDDVNSTVVIQPQQVEQILKPKQNSTLESIREGLKYFENVDNSMHECHLCSSHIHNTNRNGQKTMVSCCFFF